MAAGRREPSILDYYRQDDPDLFAKCRAFSGEAVQGMRERDLWERLYRVTVIGGLDHRIRVFNPIRGREEEPWHREALWRNVRAFVPALERAGVAVSGAQSPIVTVFVGSTRLLWAWSRRLFDAGVKCGTVAYPAVPPDEAILRLAVNARHTPEDLSRAVEVLSELAADFGVAGKAPAEIRAIGDALPEEVLQ